MKLYYKQKQMVMCNFNLGGKAVSPEITKKRPVIIIHAHKRMDSVIAVPLTSIEPSLIQKDVHIHIPKEKMFGWLSKKDSWVLCDMVYHLSNKRLDRISSSIMGRYLPLSETKVSDEIFAEVIDKVKGLF